MNLRVPTLAHSNNAIANIQLRSGELTKYQNQVSSGVRVQRPSDDPAVYPQITQAKTVSTRLDTYGQNIGAATATLNSGVRALQDINDVLVTAKQLGLQATNADAGNDPVSREALATQVDTLINRALATANGRDNEQTIFAGTATTTPPFRVATTDSAGRPLTIAYDGAPDPARTITGRGTTVDTRYVGSEVLQRPGADVFASLIGLRDALRNPSTGASAQQLTQSLADVEAARTAVGEATGQQAGNLATLDTLQSVVSSAKTDSDIRVGQLESTDFPTAIVKMKEQETALQAIYAVTAKLADPGLLSFIG